MLTLGAHLPLLRRQQPALPKHVVVARQGEEAAPVDPRAQVGGDGHVGRGGDDALGQRTVGTRDLVEHAAEARLRRHLPLDLDLGERVGRHARRVQPPRALGDERHIGEELLDLGCRQLEAGELVPFLALVDALARAQLAHLRLGHEAGVVVFMALERQAVALDGVGDEADRLVGRHRLEGLQDRLQVVAAEVGHEAGQRRIVVPAHDVERIGVDGEVVLQLAAPGLAALEHQRRVEHVGAVVDPLLEALAAGLGEGTLQELAVFQQHYFPAEVLEQARHLHEQAIGDHRVEALAVVVDDPPAVLEPVLPVFEQCLVHVAFVDLGIAHDADHAALGPIRAPALGVHVVLHQAGKAGLGDPEAHRSRGEIDVSRILGARGIGLSTAEGAEILQLVEALVAEQVLDGMEHRAGMRLDGHAVLRPKDVEIERGHQRHERGRGGLVPTHLQPVAAIDLVVGMVDHVARQPEHLALELAQHVERRGRLPRQHARTFHCQPRGVGRVAIKEKASGSHGSCGQRYRPASSRTRTRNMRQGTASCSCSQSRRKPAPITPPMVSPRG